jgi:hypothetical protein
VTYGAGRSGNGTIGEAKTIMRNPAGQGAVEDRASLRVHRTRPKYLDGGGGKAITI